MIASGSAGGWAPCSKEEVAEQTERQILDGLKVVALFAHNSLTAHQEVLNLDLDPQS